MNKILFATTNKSKIERFKSKLEEYDIQLICLNDLDISIDVVENGNSPVENALIKARSYANEVDIPVIAMDDSLYLDGVDEDDQPGLYVRRIKGKRLNDEEMIEHYRKLVKKYGINGKITARWIYGMAFVYKDLSNTFSWNKKDFYLVDKVSLNRNIDYPLNSISIQPQLNKYFSEMTNKEWEKIKDDDDDVINFIVKCQKTL